MLFKKIMTSKLSI